MSTLRFSLALAVLLAIGTPLRFAHGQIASQLDNAKHPFLFIEPDTFRPDFQFFAQADATNYEVGKDRDPNKGFFFTYDRVWMSVSRAETTVPVTPLSSVLIPFGLDRHAFVVEDPSPWNGDFTWGNRLEMGFIDHCDRGWSMVAWHVDGPNRDNKIDMIDRSIAIGDDTFQEGGESGRFYDTDYITDPDNPPFFQGLLPNDFLGDDVLANDAPLKVSHSVNLAKMSGFELNRVMERQTFHNGAVWEPLVGVRYVQFKDFWRLRGYTRSDINLDGYDDAEFYTIEQNNHINNMLGLQVGMRIFKETGHWNLSTEFKMFGMQNWQAYSAQTDNYVWTDIIPHDDPPPLPPGPKEPEFARHERIVRNANGAEFVWGGELKMEAAYQLTRDISFRTGFVFLDLGRGVARGRDRTFNDQDVQMAGVTFGFTVNR